MVDVCILLILFLIYCFQWFACPPTDQWFFGVLKFVFEEEVVVGVLLKEDVVVVLHCLVCLLCVLVAWMG